MGRWRKAAGAGALAFGVVLVGAGGSPGAGAATDQWQDEVRLRPDSVNVLLGHETDTRGGAYPSTDPLVVNPDVYTNVTVTQQVGAAGCPAGSTLVTMTGSTNGGAVGTILQQCEAHTVSAAATGEVVTTVARDTARLALPTAGFDPKVRGLVGLRTWLHVTLPDEKLASASVDAYTLRALARPVAVEVWLDGVKQAVRLKPVPGTPEDAVGPFVFTRSGRHHLRVRVMWLAEWALVDSGGAPIRFGTLSMPGPTVSTDYMVVQAQARLR